MSITTGKGDAGETELMFGRRVPKTHPQLVACGDLDELNAMLGLARALRPHASVVSWISARQRELIAVMGELATAEADLPRYQRQRFAQVTPAMLKELTDEALALEAQLTARFHDWAVPGENTTAAGAALDVARTVCRRAERSVLQSAAGSAELRAYLNRLSDFLWLCARFEARAERSATV